MLPTIKKATAVKLMAVAAFCATLLSFSVQKGGEGFEIYLNNQLVLKQYGTQMNDVKSLQLDQRYSNEQLTVKYWHCGKVGRDRIITVKDEQNKLLKEWRFANSSEPLAPMNCNVKEILSLKKGNVNTLKLYYSSSELPNGRLLASIVLGSGISTNPQRVK